MFVARHSLKTRAFLTAQTRACSGSASVVLSEQRGCVALLTLNRPKALNALNEQVMNEMIDCLQKADADDSVKAIVVTGSGKAFAAGADIAEMSTMTEEDAIKKKQFQHWDEMRKVKKPIIAAVNGFALGGGCELAMMCDIILAGEKAKFGQPEIKLGTIPGMGGSQRLTHAVGKSRAMELCLTGDFFSAQDASNWGLVSRVVAQDQLLDEAIKVGEKIGAFSPCAVAVCKDAVNKSLELPLTPGLEEERRLFYGTFATQDKMEGMAAFLEKRDANWKNC